MVLAMPVWCRRYNLGTAAWQQHSTYRWVLLVPERLLHQAATCGQAVSAGASFPMLICLASGNILGDFFTSLLLQNTVSAMPHLANLDVHSSQMQHSTHKKQVVVLAPVTGAIKRVRRSTALWGGESRSATSFVPLKKWTFQTRRSRWAGADNPYFGTT